MEIYLGDNWNNVIAGLPGAHILQSWEWGQFKIDNGWTPMPYIWRDEHGKVFAAALILKRMVAGGLNVLYIPRGPMTDWNNPTSAVMVLHDLRQLAKREKSIFIKLDGEIVVGNGVPGSDDDYVNQIGEQIVRDMSATGWVFSQDQIQFRNTVVLDLTGGEDIWLERMKQKTRYNLRLAQRRGVYVRHATVEDLPVLYRMYAETSVRDGFVIRSEQYYLKLWRLFMERDLAVPLLAEVDGEFVSGLLLFCFAGRAWYLHGMSVEKHREKMPNYLLQWEAMKLAASRGCTAYDLWGAPDEFVEQDSMWGVFRFKDGLGGKVVRTAGAWDYPTRPLLYVLYTRVLPRILDMMRRRGKARTRQEVA